MILSDTAYAKLNLALHVRGRRADGYHELETLFAFCADGDRLTAAPAERLTLAVTGPFAGALAGENLVLSAAESLARVFGVRAGAVLTLDKRLPVASGIGGGSADAAAALRLLARLWRIDLADPRVEEVACGLGADVPACLRSSSALGRARGDVLEPVTTGFEGRPALLVNPLVPVSTAAVFAAWDGVDRGALDAGEPAGWRNDLATPARALAPAIDGLLAALERAPGAVLVRMSGSGATCFALFEEVAARNAAADAMPPAWWRMATVVRDGAAGWSDADA